jgi:hypothetical protein
MLRDKIEKKNSQNKKGIKKAIKRMRIKIE